MDTSSMQDVLRVDLEGSPGVIRYVPSTGEHFKVNVVGGPVTFVIPVEGRPNEYLISIGQDIVIMEWDGKSSKPSKITKLAEILSTKIVSNR